MPLRLVIQMIVAAILLSLTLPGWSCLNDRDTLAQEAKGLPQVIQVLTGRFPRNPPLYYQMRITRITGELSKNPKRLSEYDDIAVANDRLGRDTEAIAWMERKRQHLPSLTDANASIKEEWYKYYANTGTFWVHRWLHDGADAKRIREAERAEAYITKAIEIRANAHEGREKYQLAAIHWMIAGKTHKGKSKSNALVNGINGDKNLKDDMIEQRIQGLSGLITLGSAWESVDMFDALGEALAYDEEHELAYLTFLRRDELIKAGHHALFGPGSLTNTANMYFGPQKTHPVTEQNYYRLRQEADQWQKSRTDFMMQSLTKGHHPDTDPTFWNGYHETVPPKITDPETDEKQRVKRIKNMEILIILSVFVFSVLGLPVWLGWKWRERVRREAALKEDNDMRKITTP